MKLFYDLAPWVALVFNLFIIFLVLRRYRHSHLHRVFAFFIFSMALWAITVLGMRLSPSFAHSLIWQRAVIIALGLVAVSFYHFVLSFSQSKHSVWQIILPYICLAGFAIAVAPTNLLIDRMRVMWYGRGFVPGSVLLPFLVLNYGLVILSLVTILRAYRKSDSLLDKKCFLLVAYGTIFCLLGVLSDLFAARGAPVYPMGIPSNVVFAILCTYAFLRFRLLNVTLILRKGTTYILAYAVGTVLYVGLVFLAYTVVTRSWSLVDWLSILFLLVITVGLHPLLRKTQQRVDKWFYRERYDFLHALEGLGEEIKDITELSKTANRLVETVMAAMKCRTISIFLPDADSSYFTSVASRGDINYASLRLHQNNTLLWWLNKSGEPVTQENINLLPTFQALSAREKENIVSLKAEVFIPLMTREGLRGVLVMGPHISGQEYSWEDIRLLKVVAHQVATTVDNARLYEMQKKRYLEQALLARLAQIVAAESDMKQMLALSFKELKESALIDYSAITLVEAGNEGSKIVFSWDRFHPGEIRSSYDVISEQGGFEPARSSLPEYESTLKLPLKSKDKLLGEMVLASRELNIYNDSNIKLLQRVAVQLAIGIEKAQLSQLEKEAREELQEQYNQRTNFINSLVHEVKTPVTAIITSAELLSEELVTDSPTLSGLADNLNVAAHNLDRRINELMDFVKFQFPHMRLNLKMTNLTALCESVASQMSGLFRSKSQRLNLALSPLDGQVLADPERITQVLMNLLNNASKFSEADGDIRMSLYTSDSEAVVEVLDGAPPMNQQEAKNIFKIYYRGSHKSASGLGLGLYICKKLIEKHGGKIWLETNYNHNCFKFTLPLVKGERVEQESNESLVG